MNFNTRFGDVCSVQTSLSMQAINNLYILFPFFDAEQFKIMSMSCNFNRNRFACRAYEYDTFQYMQMSQ